MKAIFHPGDLSIPGPLRYYTVVLGLQSFPFFARLNQPPFEVHCEWETIKSDPLQHNR